MEKTKLFSLILGVFTMSLAVGYLAFAAWTEPIAPPPGDNVPAPLNVGHAIQTKTGGLGIGGGFSVDFSTFVVDAVNDRVGIGTTAPTRILGLGGTAARNIGMERGTVAGTAGFALTVNAGGATSGATNRAGGDLILASGVSTGNTVSNVIFQTSGGGTSGTADRALAEVMRITGIGNVGIGTTATALHRLNVNGSVGAISYFHISDKTLKENIQTIPGALENILKLRGVKFNWKDSGQPSVGLVAQEVEKTFPEAVTTDKETGLKSVDYAKLVAPLIEAIKEQQKEIEELKTEIDDLKLKINPR